MARDRMDAFRAVMTKDGDHQENGVAIEMEECYPNVRNTDMEQFFKEVEDLSEFIDRMKKNVEEVKKTHSTILSSPHTDDDVKQNLEKFMADIKTSANQIRSKLKHMEHGIEQIAQSNEFSAAHRIRKTQHHMLSSRFVEVMTDYQATQTDYRERCKGRIKRQLSITGRKTTDDEIEEMIESGNPAIFTRGIIMETKQARQTLADIEARHSDIMKLEKSIRELRDMFLDMAILVESQGEMIDRIEFHVQQSKSHVDKGKLETNQAMTYRAKARWKKLVCLVLIIILILIVIGSVIGTS